MNTIQHSFNQSSPFTINEVYDAYIECKKGKKSINALVFEQHLEENIFSLLEDLNTNTYSISRAICFAVTVPKIREIWASDFRDRVVHHLITRKVEEFYENNSFQYCFLHSSYANRVGKGTHSAYERARVLVKEYKYYAQLDIKSFFNSIDKEILYTILESDLKQITIKNKKRILDLFKQIIFHKYTSNYKNQTPDLFKKVPFHKSLFFSEPQGRGIPIGNLTSQFLSNVYLNKLDYYIEKTLGYEHKYIRYVDDFVLFSDSKEELSQHIEQINCFLQTTLRLELHPQKILLNECIRGVAFLGYVIKPQYVLVRNNVVKQCNSKLYSYYYDFSKSSTGKKQKKQFLRKDEVDEMYRTMNSYIAHFNKANAYNLTYKMTQKLQDYFLLEKKRINTNLNEISNKHKNTNIVLKKKHSLEFKYMWEQYMYFKEKYPRHIIIFQMGNFYRCFDEQAEFVAEKLDLKLQVKMYSKQNHLLCGFPITSKKKEKFKELNIKYAFVKQLSNELHSGLKERIEEFVDSSGEDFSYTSSTQADENYSTSSLDSVLDWDLII